MGGPCEVGAERVPIGECRPLSGCAEGGARMAVNGRRGRRTVCVLDGSGCELETVDVAGGGEGM